MRPSNLFLAAVLATSIDIGGAVAQDAQPDAHHPGATAEEKLPAPPAHAGPGQPAEPGAMDPGMMGPDMMRPGMPGSGLAMMQRCMAMMREMDPADKAEMHERMGRMHGKDGMDADHGDMAAATSDDPVQAAFAAINRRMHDAMLAPAGASPDMAFAQGMIAHHQGAIDMAKVILGFGQDPDIRRLAEEVVAAQEKEITFLEDWLAKQRKE